MGETTEQISLGTLGFLGMTVPSLADLSQDVQAWTLIFSFFFIVVPTGIWACCRALGSIKKTFGK